MHNIVYIDNKMKGIKTTIYAKFDEAHFSISNKPPGAKILMDLGMPFTSIPSPLPNTTDTNVPQIVKHHLNAVTHMRGLEAAAGYDLYSILPTVISSQDLALINTGISMKFPSSTYGGIAS